MALLSYRRPQHETDECFLKNPIDGDPMIIAMSTLGILGIVVGGIVVVLLLLFAYSYAQAVKEAQR